MEKFEFILMLFELFPLEGTKFDGVQTTSSSHFCNILKRKCMMYNYLIH